MPDPGDVGHDGHPFPTGQMLDSEFEVFPFGAEIDSGELRTQFVVKPQLGISLQRLVYCRYHHLQVVLSRHFALGQNSHYIVGKAFDNLDHGAVSSRSN